MKVLFSLNTILCASLTSVAAGATDFRGGLDWSNGWYDLSLAPIAPSGGIIGGIACGARDGALNSPSAPLTPPNGSAGVSQYGANYLECICQNINSPVPLDSCPGECTHTPGAPIPNGVIQHSTLAALFPTGTTAVEPAAATLSGAFAASSDGNLYYLNMGSNPCFYPGYLGDPSGGRGDPSMGAWGAWGLVDALPTSSVLGLAFLPGTESTADLFALGNDNTVYWQDFYGDGWASTGLQGVASISYSPSVGAIVALLSDGEFFYASIDQAQETGQWVELWPAEPPCTLNWNSTQDCMMAVGGVLGAWWSSSGPQFGSTDGNGWYLDAQATSVFQSNAAQVGAYSTGAPALFVLGQDPAFNPPSIESWQTLFEGASWAPFGDSYWVITNKYRLYAFQP